MDSVDGVIEVGHNEKGEIVISYSDIRPDSLLVLSRSQARHLAYLLQSHATKVENEALLAEQLAKQKAAEAVPVDRSAVQLSDGRPVTEDHREINSATGQQKGYIVLRPEERAKGFVRPVRRSYIHIVCGTLTTMSQAIAETYARSPGFYSGTFCAHCKDHFPVGETGEFKWEDGTMVAS